jgi:RNA polymerase sigma factor (sigma-70 family)
MIYRIGEIMNFKNWIISEETLYIEAIVSLLVEGYMDDAADAYAAYVQDFEEQPLLSRDSWETFNAAALTAAEKLMKSIQFKRRGFIDDNITDDVVGEVMLKLTELKKNQSSGLRGGLPLPGAFKAWFRQAIINFYNNISKGKKIDRMTKSASSLEKSGEDSDSGFKMDQLASRDPSTSSRRGRENAQIFKLPHAEEPQNLSAIPDEAKEIFLQLSGPSQQAAMLYYMQNKSYQEIADILGIPLNTVRSRMFELRKKLEKVPGLVIPSQNQGEYDPSVPRSKRLYGKKKIG